jgi:quercetin dioxygenase-like cupin family protein
MEAGIGRAVRIGGLELRFLIDETSGTGSLVIFEFIVPPNARVPAPHFHREVDEVIYALEGATTTTRGGQKHELRAGQSLFVPRGVVHTHENLHGETARSLIVMSPGTIGRRYFEEIAAEVNGPGKPEPARIKEIMLRHGLVAA